MSSSFQSEKEALPRNLDDRIRLGGVSLILGGFGGFGVFVFLVTPLPKFGWLGTMLVVVTEELMLAMAVFFGLLLIWSIATPRWVEWLFQHARKKLWIVMTVAFIPIIILAGFAAMGLKLNAGLVP